MDQETDQGYFPEPAKLLFIEDNPDDKEVARQELNQAGLNIN